MCDKNLMKNFFNLCFVTLILLFGCKTAGTDINYGSSIQTNLVGQQSTITKKYQLKRPQFNAFCKTQKIPSNLKLWSSVSYKDYETGNAISQSVYLKDDRTDDQISSDVYRLNLKIVQRDTTFIILHRHTH